MERLKRLKLVLLGSHRVGKSSIIGQFINNYFDKLILPTFNTDKSFKEIELINGKKIDLEIGIVLVVKLLGQKIKYFLIMLK